MPSILGCSNGAQVEQYLRQSMRKHNMVLEPGICTALNKGILACGGDVPKNFTPFLLPPAKDNDTHETSSDLLKLAVQEKFDNKDLVLMTKMDVTIPMCTQDLRIHIKNTAGLAGRCLGQDSTLHMSLRNLAEHIEENDTSYSYEFRQEKLFGGHFLDMIHWRIHRFFYSCAGGDASQIDMNKVLGGTIREGSCKGVTKLVVPHSAHFKNKLGT